jgi:Fe-S-cluster-containing hydrogenase component 2
MAHILLGKGGKQQQRSSCPRAEGLAKGEESMAQEKERPGGIDRREFIAGAIVSGAVSTLAVYSPAVGEGSEIPSCRVILHDPARCVGCGVCGMMCSLYHEGEVGSVLSRAEVVRNPFTYDFGFNVCRQCRSPRCYRACPLQDIARLVDDETGTVYVNEDACIGCGICVAACPFDPPRTKLHPERRVAVKCDLCMTRDEGPICVAYCNMNALTCAPEDSVLQPRRPSGRSTIT